MNKVVCICMVQLDRECEYRLDLKTSFYPFIHEYLKEVKIGMRMGLLKNADDCT